VCFVLFFWCIPLFSLSRSFSPWNNSIRLDISPTRRSGQSLRALPRGHVYHAQISTRAAIRNDFQPQGGGDDNCPEWEELDRPSQQEPCSSCRQRRLPSTARRASQPPGELVFLGRESTPSLTHPHTKIPSYVIPLLLSLTHTQIHHL
jgi:hypothetical protein